jgi:hypothetical protein
MTFIVDLEEMLSYKLVFMLKCGVQKSVNNFRNNLHILNLGNSSHKTPLSNFWDLQLQFITLPSIIFQGKC